MKVEVGWGEKKKRKRGGWERTCSGQKAGAEPRGASARVSKMRASANASAKINIVVTSIIHCCDNVVGFFSFFLFLLSLFLPLLPLSWSWLLRAASRPRARSRHYGRGALLALSAAVRRRKYLHFAISSRRGRDARAAEERWVCSSRGSSTSGARKVRRAAGGGRQRCGRRREATAKTTH